MIGVGSDGRFLRPGWDYDPTTDTFLFDPARMGAWLDKGIDPPEGLYICKPCGVDETDRPIQPDGTQKNTTVYRVLFLPKDPSLDPCLLGEGREAKMAIMVLEHANRRRSLP